MNSDLKLYDALLQDIKLRVRQGQLRANLKANAEMLATYWDIGRMIHERQQKEGWGAAVIPRLANDLKNELTKVKGFSERNLKTMIQFYKEYSNFPIGQRPVAQLEKDQIQNDLILLTGWAHHIILIQKVKELSTRYWYMQQSNLNGWTRDTLIETINTNLHLRQGNTINNFDITLPQLQSALAKETLKDPYIFDFTTLSIEFTERDLELQLIKHLQKFLIELGAGFAFVGRHYKLNISDRDFYIDLLFYHLKMR